MVITDYSDLTKLMNGKNVSSRMVHWSLTLADYNVYTEYKA